MPATILSCDWGTTNVRLRRVEIASRRVVSETSAAAGVKEVFDAWKRTGGDRLEHYDEALRPLLETLGRRESDRALVISGMASSSIGMAELPYAEVPFRLDGSDVEYRVMESRVVACPLLLLSGVRTPDDVMRGEETELIGLCRSIAAPASPSLFILPGTHSKHVYVDSGAIVSFRTYMTGELFDMLANASILRESVREVPFNRQAFELGVRASRDRPLLSGLFTVRTHRLFDRIDAGESYWYLSGLLVGYEVGAPAAAPVFLCGMSRLAPLYRAAIEALDAADRTVFVEGEITERSAAEGHVVAFERVLAEG